MTGLTARVTPDVQRWVQEGLRLQRNHHPPQARQCYEKALKIDPSCFDALQLLGVLRFRGGDCEAGIGLLQRALALHPGHAPTLNNLGNALRAAGRLPEALDAYQRAVRAFREAPPVVLRNLGSALLDLGDAVQAGPLLGAAAAGAPADAIAWCWLGHHARAERRAGDAIEHYRKALKLDATLAEAQHGLGNAHLDLNRYPEAVEAFRRACEMQPQALLPAVSRAHAQLAIADWRDFGTAVRTMEQASPQPDQMVNPMKPALFTDEPRVLRRYAEGYAAHYLGMSVRRGPRDWTVGRDRGPDSRIRVGYLSADLRDHPVGRLLAAVVECHDRGAFDIRLFALGQEDNSDVRARLAAVVPPLRVGSLSDVQLTHCLREAKLDVLIDLAGYTDQHRARVLAARAAPVQAGWLGFPGTLGESINDYLIADGYTIPEGEESGYAEHIVRLPDCLLPGDSLSAVAEPRPRAAYGLPQNAVVLCSFNQTRKLNPLLFDVWMDVLREVPGAVLWLSEERTEASANLRQAAAARGVEPQRLVFAPRMEGHAAHLARYRVADLALDTFPYGSHSTALDALWAGCPLIAWVGRSFPARVSGAALKAVGLPELIAQSAAQYRALIASLAGDAARRTVLRDRLIASRRQCALFDAPRFTSALERALLEMTRRARQGLAPQHLWIP